jgi:hypothetical protein
MVSGGVELHRASHRRSGYGEPGCRADPLVDGILVSPAGRERVTQANAEGLCAHGNNGVPRRTALNGFYPVSETLLSVWDA